MVSLETRTSLLLKHCLWRHHIVPWHGWARHGGKVAADLLSDQRVFAHPSEDRKHKLRCFEKTIIPAS
jgi:hypothetical protein